MSIGERYLSNVGPKDVYEGVDAVLLADVRHRLR
jgi:hypothetical protein